ncbi:MAG: PTS transporter subunit EIIC [Hespellia sp.]|nr:PTS transporter subunit EIIC [Hespellia sp.]
MRYEKLVCEILDCVGGKENIDSVVHCATRLRFHVKDESLVKEEKLKNIDGVLSLIQSGGQHQVVIGTYVADVYKEFIQVSGLSEEDAVDEDVDLKDAAKMKAELKDKKVKSSLIDLISGIFAPVLGIMMATGFIKGILVLLTTIGVLSSDSGTYQILYMIADSFFYFLPIFLGYTAMKKFGGTPFLGMTIGAVLLYPTISTIVAGDALYTLFAGTAFEMPVYATFCGIPVLLRSYASTVFPVIFICYLAAKLEKFFDKKISGYMKTMLVPALTLMISLVLGFVIVGPVISIISDAIGSAMSWLFEISSLVGGFLYGALIQFCVVFGVHWGFVAICMNNMSSMGYDPVTIAGLASAFGQIGVVTVIMLKVRNKKTKGVCASAIISGLFGITEPAIYGVTLQNKMAFILASVASGVGGAIIGFFGVKQYTFGANGVFGWIQVINPETGFDPSVIAAIVACIVSYVLGVVLMATVGKKSINVEK